MSFDGARGCTVLFGGTDGATLFSDTWEFAGLDWSPCATTSAPPARHGHVQVYDTTRQRTVVYGGASATGALRDTWTWDGVAWSPLVTAHRPDAGEGVCAAYDADRQEVVLFGGDGTRGELWRLRDPGLGTWLPQGTGCSTGYGDLTLTAINNAAIASVMQFSVDHLPSHFALLASVWFGFDDQQWNGAPLPASLAVAGAPACYVRLDPQVPTWAANAGTGHASSSIVVPNLPAFVGMQIFAQAVAWDLLTGTVTTSNSLAARLRGY